jgi:hypothetical protein
MRLTAGLLALLLLVACSDEGPPLPRDEFLQRADEICLEARQARIVLNESAGEVTDAYIEDLKGIQENATEQFEALIPPDELQDLYERFVESARQIADDPEAAAEVFDEFVSLAKELGLAGCAQGTEEQT